MSDEPVEKQTDIEGVPRCWKHGWQHGSVFQERPKCRSWFRYLEHLPIEYRNIPKKRPTGQVIRMKRCGVIKR